jgi:hypothetical protein
MYLAFFKGQSSGLAGLFDVVDHAWMEGPHSHSELVFSDGRSASATLDSGVRFTVPGSINFADTTQWDCVQLSPKYFDEGQALLWYSKHDGCKYDVWGDAHFVDGLLHHQANHFFCSESNADALQFEQGWRLDPNALYIVAQRFSLLP